MSTPQQEYSQAANYLHHVSMWYVGAFIETTTGKRHGMIPADYPGLKTSRDFIDLILFTRAEINVLTSLLLNRLGFKLKEIQTMMAEEYRRLADDKARQFGFKVSEYGLVFEAAQQPSEDQSKEPPHGSAPGDERN